MPQASAQSPNRDLPTGEPPIDLHLGYTQVVLRNGLTVLIHRDPTLPVMSVNLWYRVGSRDEPPGRTGFAHLFEHLMFEGSRNVPEGAFDTLLEDVGAHSNGSTSTDRTNYWINGPSNALELALWLEADRMATLLDAVDQGKLDVQRAVVKNERRQSYENRPYGLAWESVLSLLYPDGHPYRWPVIGSMEDLAAASLEDVQAFFRQWYAPNNAILAVAGNVSPENVITLAERHFGGIPRGAPVERRAAPPPVVLESEGRRVLEDDVQLPRLYLAWHAPAAFAPGDAALQVAAWILGGGRSSRLHRRLVQELQIAQEVWAIQEGSLDSGVFEIVVTGRPGEPLEPLEAQVRAELEAFVAEGVTAREVAGALNRIETSFVERVERVGGFGGKADLLNEYYMFLGDPGYLTRDVARFRGVTPASVRDATKATLLDRHGVVVSVVPRTTEADGVPRAGEDPEVATDPVGVDPLIPGGMTVAAPPTEAPTGGQRPTVPPTPGPLPTLSIPVPQTFELSNGIPVQVVPRRGVSMVSIQVLFPGQPQAGLAGFATSVMEEGTSTRSGAEIAEEIEFLGASLSVTAGWDGVLASLTGVRPRMEAALHVFADVLRNPVFPPSEVDRLRRERKNRILQAAQDPRSVATNRFLALVNGSDQPYGVPLLGTEAQLDELGREDLASFHQRVVAPSNAVIVVTGDVTVAVARDWLEEAFGDWVSTPGAQTLSASDPSDPSDPSNPSDPSKPPAETRKPDGSANEEAREVTIYLVHRPGAAQSEIRVGRPGPSRATEDFYALELLNSALGGSFTSRLNQNLREDKGFTYGAGSAFQMRRAPSAFVAATAVHTPVTADALSEILRELDGIRGAEPLSADELARARNFVSVQLIERFETTADLADRFGEGVLLGRPADAWSQYVAGVRGVVPEDVTAAAARWLSGPLVVVVVGDRHEIEAPLRALGVGPVIVDDPGADAGEEGA